MWRGQNLVTGQGGLESRVTMPLCCPRDPETSLDNTWRWHRGHMENWWPLRKESRTEEKKNKD